MKYYISDLHLGHANVLNFDNRPFSTLEEMEETIVKNWNAVVTDNDDVYILGDVVWKNSYWETIKNLKGRKHLVKGNHDRLSAEAKACFVSINDYEEIKDGNTPVILSHFPIASWNRMTHGSVHLYGHVHNNWEMTVLDGPKAAFEKHFEKPYLAFNVGCMLSYMNYTPRTLEEIMEGAKDGNVHSR